MQQAPQRFHAGKVIPDEIHRHIIALRPKELLEIHRIHLDPILLGRNDNLLHILIDGNERACLKIIVPPVRDQGLDRLTRPREPLNLVKYEQSLSLVKPNTIMCGKLQEERIQLLKIVLKQLPDILSRLAEVYENIGLVLVLGKLFGNIALSDTTRPVNQQGRCACIPPLPLKQCLVNLPLHARIPLSMPNCITFRRVCSTAAITIRQV